MLHRLILFFALLGLPAFAADLPEAVAKRIAAQPERFVTFASDVIHGFGQAGRLDAAGLESFLALERASARASALRQIHAGDMDGDGTVTRAELGVLAAASSARARGRLWRQFDAADAQPDGRVTGAEITRWANAEAARRLSRAVEGDARAILTFDRDKDGMVTEAELRKGVAFLSEAA